LTRERGYQTQTFQRLSFKQFQILPKVASGNNCQAGMFAFGSQILVPNVDEFIKSDHTRAIIKI
jgi:hypothetical protein